MKLIIIDIFSRDLALGIVSKNNGYFSFSSIYTNRSKDAK